MTPQVAPDEGRSLRIRVSQDGARVNIRVTGYEGSQFRFWKGSREKLPQFTGEDLEALVVLLHDAIHNALCQERLF